MRTLLSLILFVLLVDLLFNNCANPKSPSGGPKDTIPPILLASYPVQGSTQFNDVTFRLEFSEYVNADKIAQNLIITPKTDIRYKTIAKKNLVTIRFEEPFSDSTTYNLNFFDGITDITEKNPAVNLTLAFSTGTYIDSMKVSGQVQDLLTAQPAKKFVVGLYELTDTLDFLKENPLYFTTTNDSGLFDISYIKTGIYKILAFKDDNRNLILDPDVEDHGFLQDTLNLTSPLTDLQISTILQNVKPIQLINNRAIGKYHEIRYNRELDNYELTPDSLYSNIVGEKKEIIRLYNPEQFAYGDSLELVVLAADSLENSTNDTLKIVFNESDRKPSDFNFTLNYKEKQLLSQPSYELTFNKPILSYDLSHNAYRSDSTFTYPIDSFTLDWNDNRTAASLTNFVIADSIYAAYERQFTQDTLSLPDTLRQFAKTSPIEFYLDSISFISVENDTAESKIIKHKRAVKETTGSLTLNLSTDQSSFIVQLLKGKEVKYQRKNTLKPTFLVEPASYKIRILIDTNNDGKWSFGNLLKNIEPEPVYLFDEDISVRANWVIEDINISF